MRFGESSRMKFLRLLSVAFIALLCAPSLPAADKKLTVGFSQIGAESAWRTAETESIRSEATKRGVNLRFSRASCSRWSLCQRLCYGHGEARRRRARELSPGGNGKRAERVAE